MDSLATMVKRVVGQIEAQFNTKKSHPNCWMRPNYNWVGFKIIDGERHSDGRFFAPGWECLVFCDFLTFPLAPVFFL